MTAINHQNTWHSKETKKDYGPCTPVNGSKYDRTDYHQELPVDNFLRRKCLSIISYNL